MTLDKEHESSRRTPVSMAKETLREKPGKIVSNRRQSLPQSKVDEPHSRDDAAATFLDRPQAVEQRRSLANLIMHFVALTRGQRTRIAFALSMLTVAALLTLIPPASAKLIFDYVLIAKPLPEIVTNWLALPRDPWMLLLLVMGVLVVLAFLRLVVRVCGQWYATLAATRLQLSFRKTVFEHMMLLPLVRLHDLKSGGVVSVLQQDTACIGELANNLLLKPWESVLRLIGTLLVLAYVDWRMLLGTLVLFPPIYILHRTWAHRIRPQHRDIHGQRQKIDAHVAEAFSGIRMVRAFGRQRCEAARFVRHNHLWARRHLRVWWWTRSLELMFSSLIVLSTATILIYGGWQVVHQNLSVGDVMMFLVYVLMLLQPFSVLAQSATALQTNLAAFDRILDLLDEPRELVSSPNAVTVRKSDVQGRITIKNVSFRYPGASSYALEEVDLDVQPGQTIALVGRSGSGKTTICNLVARFYDPTDGEILLDGQDLRSIEVECYRRLLGVVEQEVFLFDGTVTENIGYARRGAADLDITRAAAIANADEFIRELPHGYDTLIGQQGVKLSGGQRQRIAIARAVLADPRILILDEATSNLDTQSESLIQDSLQDLMQDRTCFVIAHRLSTITHADRILVLDGGRVIECGTQQELMEANGEYHDMVFTQVDSMSPLLRQRYTHDS